MIQVGTEITTLWYTDMMYTKDTIQSTRLSKFSSSLSLLLSFIAFMLIYTDTIYTTVDAFTTVCGWMVDV